MPYVSSGPVAGLGIRPDRGMIAAGAFDKMVYVIDTRSWRVMSVSFGTDRLSLCRYMCRDGNLKRCLGSLQRLCAAVSASICVIRCLRVRAAQHTALHAVEIISRCTRRSSHCNAPKCTALRSVVPRELIADAPSWSCPSSP